MTDEQVLEVLNRDPHVMGRYTSFDWAVPIETINAFHDLHGYNPSGRVVTAYGKWGSHTFGQVVGLDDEVSDHLDELFQP